MFDYFSMADNYDERKVGRWDSGDRLKMVSTCSVTDGRKPFETAIAHPAYNKGKMVIVECYSTDKDAEIGHERWLELMLRDKLPLTLVDCVNSEISQLCGEFGAPMAFEKKCLEN